MKISKKFGLLIFLYLCFSMPSLAHPADVTIKVDKNLNFNGIALTKNIIIIHFEAEHNNIFTGLMGKKIILKQTNTLHICSVENYHFPDELQPQYNPKRKFIAFIKLISAKDFFSIKMASQKIETSKFENATGIISFYDNKKFQDTIKNNTLENLRYLFSSNIIQDTSLNSRIKQIIFKDLLPFWEDITEKNLIGFIQTKEINNPINCFSNKNEFAGLIIDKFYDNMSPINDTVYYRFIRADKILESFKVFNDIIKNKNQINLIQNNQNEKLFNNKTNNNAPHQEKSNDNNPWDI